MNHHDAASAGAADYRPPWWLPSGHAQTVFAALLRRPATVDWHLQRWDTRDGDFVRVHVTGAPPDAPIALLVHGLEGSARAHYMRGLGSEFSRRGARVAAMELRSCGGEPNRTATLYHSGATDDLDCVIERLVAAHPRAKLFVVGVSLGGNLLARWLAERAAAKPPQLRAAALLSAPFDLAASAAAIDRPAMWAYRRAFLTPLIAKVLDVERRFPGIVDADKVRRSRTMAAFDQHATAVLHGFASAEDYWQCCSCGPILHRIRTPTLIVAAADDPFVPVASWPRGPVHTSAYTTALWTRRGGHVGFVSGPPWRPGSWAEQRIGAFFDEHCRATRQQT